MSDKQHEENEAVTRRRLIQNAALSGAALMTTSGAAAMAQTPSRTQPAATPRANGDILNARDFGAIPNSERDQTAALQRAIDAAGKSGARLHLPAGVFRYTTLRITSPLLLEGNGPRTTTLRKTTATGDGVSVTAPQVHIRDLGFDASTRQTAGTFVRFAENTYECSVEEFVMSGAFVGVWNGGAHRMNIEKGSIRDAATGVGSAGIVIRGGNDHYIRQITMDNRADAMPESGIRIDNTGCINITDTDVIHCNRDLWLRGEGGGVFAVYVANTYFDTATYGIYIETKNPIVRCKFVNVYACSHTENAVRIESGGLVDSIEFVNCMFSLNQKDGVVWNGGTNLSLIGSTLAANGNENRVAATGLVIGADVREARVCNNKIGGTDPRAMTGQRVGIAVSGDGGHIISGNNLRGNTEAAMRGDGGASSLVKDNLV